MILQGAARSAIKAAWLTGAAGTLERPARLCSPFHSFSKATAAGCSSIVTDEVFIINNCLDTRSLPANGCTCPLRCDLKRPQTAHATRETSAMHAEWPFSRGACTVARVECDQRTLEPDAFTLKSSRA